MKDRNGWDGKLRVDDPECRHAVLANPEALGDTDCSDEDALPVEEICADEGISPLFFCLAREKGKKSQDLY